jgi:hypothetical protein
MTVGKILLRTVKKLEKREWVVMGRGSQGYSGSTLMLLVFANKNKINFLGNHRMSKAHKQSYYHVFFY